MRRDFDDVREMFRRWLCSMFGHVPAAQEAARPVTAFVCCARCGKIGERLP